MLTPTMTAHQAEALAAYLVTLRPGQRHWTKQACVEALRQAAAVHTADALTLERAALAVARDPKAVTPAVIAQPGRHWETAAAGHGDERIPKPDWCRRCMTYHRPDQPCPERMPERQRADASPHLAQARAELRARRHEPKEPADATQ